MVRSKSHKSNSRQSSLYQKNIFSHTYITFEPIKKKNEEFSAFKLRVVDTPVLPRAELYVCAGVSPLHIIFRMFGRLINHESVCWLLLTNLISNVGKKEQSFVQRSSKHIPSTVTLLWFNWKKGGKVEKGTMDWEKLKLHLLKILLIMYQKHLKPKTVSASK